MFNSGGGGVRGRQQPPPLVRIGLIRSAQSLPGWEERKALYFGRRVGRDRAPWSGGGCWHCSGRGIRRDQVKLKGSGNGAGGGGGGGGATLVNRSLSSIIRSGVCIIERSGVWIIWVGGRARSRAHTPAASGAMCASSNHVRPE